VGHAREGEHLRGGRHGERDEERLGRDHVEWRVGVAVVCGFFFCGCFCCDGAEMDGYMGGFKVRSAQKNVMSKDKVCTW
jgi:hypothetical protein